jgi:hypothetical protein
MLMTDLMPSCARDLSSVSEGCAPNARSSVSLMTRGCAVMAEVYRGILRGIYECEGQIRETCCCGAKVVKTNHFIMYKNSSLRRQVDKQFMNEQRNITRYCQHLTDTCH